MIVEPSVVGGAPVLYSYPACSLSGLSYVAYVLKFKAPRSRSVDAART
jgi:hypothetical protein